MRRPALQLALLPLLLVAETAAAQGVQLLNEGDTVASDSQPGNLAEARIEIPASRVPAVVIITADGESHYKGPTATSGIVVRIQRISERGEEMLAQDDSLEAQSIDITYHASAAAVLRIQPSSAPTTIKATTEPYGSLSAGNKNTKVKLRVVALAAQ